MYIWEQTLLQYAVQPQDATESHTMGLQKTEPYGGEYLITCFSECRTSEPTAELIRLNFSCSLAAIEMSQSQTEQILNEWKIALFSSGRSDSKPREVEQTCDNYNNRAGGKKHVGRRKKKKLHCKIQFEFKPRHCTHCFTRLSPSLPLILPRVHFFCQLHLPLVPLVRGQTELCMGENCHDLKHPRKPISHLFLTRNISHWQMLLTRGHFLRWTGWYSMLDCPLVSPSPN